MSVPEQHDKAAQHGPVHPRTIASAVAANQRSLQLTAIIVAFFLIDFLWSVHTQHVAQGYAVRTQRAATAQVGKVIAAGCNFWEPLVGLPVTLQPGAARPTKVGVQILAGARESYRGQCHPPAWPPLPPAQPSLVTWARYYHISVR